MMGKRLTLLLILISFWAVDMTAQTLRLSGRVSDKTTGESVTGAVLRLGDDYLWAVSDVNGEFEFKNISGGKYGLEVTCLGYVSSTINVDITDDMRLEVLIQESSLALDEVVVTAKKTKDGLNTSRTLGRDALNHLQISNMADISALLPGGKTINPDLTTDNRLTLRDGGLKEGNIAFGTAVEVDGVRLNNNAGFGEMDGVSTRNIAVENIESIEVMTGVPSAEYGDLNSGLIKIHTKKGYTPVNVTFSVNPRTYQISASKGIDLQKERGILNVSAEWANATKKLISPYESYTRAGMTLTYTNTFRKVFRFEAGMSGNFGGMNSKDDPDAFTGAYEKAMDNSLRAHGKLTWQLNRSWITNLKFETSVNFQDNRIHSHDYFSYASSQPAVHSEEEGYFIATQLPTTYFTDQINDSKELDIAASVKYEWNKNFSGYKSRLKAGIQWKSNGNVGEGEYYQDPALAANEYRPRPYHEYPFMHNLSAYLEETFSTPVGKTTLEIMAGLRMENVFIKGSNYKNKTTLSPRLNLKWKFNKNIALRAGWGITEKLPSFFILYPKQEYRDILSSSFSSSDSPTYIYFSQPYQMVYNPDLRWQKNMNSEVGLDMEFGEFNISLVGYYNLTKDPYVRATQYTPISYNVYQLAPGKTVPADGNFTIDVNTGAADFLDLLVTDRTFAGTTMQKNGANVHRAGLELEIDFPEIKAIRTKFRFDASYNHTYYLDENLNYNYQSGRSHTSIKNMSYQWVGIYANGMNSSTISNGKVTHSIDANLTAITHIPRARIIITCRLEASLLKLHRNISEYQGKEYAYNVAEGSTAANGGSIYDGGSYTAIRPVAYMDVNGNIHPFTDAEAADPQMSSLILKSGNKYTFMQDGYGPYFAANLSITKEIGNVVSLSFFANNFTYSRMAVSSFATGVSTIFTPAFYYGLTCRLKF